MTNENKFVSALRDLVVDVDAMGGIRIDSRGRVLGLLEEVDTRNWANLATIVKSASELLAASGYPESLSHTESPDEIYQHRGAA